MNDLVKNATFGFSVLRSISFAAQSLSLPFLEVIASRDFSKLDAEKFKKLGPAYKDLIHLLKKDSDNIAAGIYPVEVLKPKGPVRAMLQYQKVVLDGFKITQKRKNKLTHEFKEESNQYLNDVPEYYRRNFHFQTDGYLSEASANLYEHQVEILFSGAADPMRRLILPMMKKHFTNSKGKGLHFLEVAAGTGALTKFVKLAFPEARITVLDLSYPYLKKAQDVLKDFTRIDFVQGDAAKLQFSDESFDGIFSSFLFHELPIEERRKVISESMRVLKKGGFFGMVDSIQTEDQHDYDWALNQFPVDFHEPFYRNYLQNPMEGLLSHAGFKNIEKDMGFLAKAISASKQD